MPLQKFRSSGGLDANGQTISNVATPISATDGATKGYIDTLLSELGGGDAWLETAKIISSDIQSADRFGYAVSISDDGNSAVVGAYLEDTGGDRTGAAYIYTYVGYWLETAKIQASDKAAGDWFGRTVSISGNGDVVVVGSAFSDPVVGGNNSGSAYVFSNSSGSWMETDKLVASDAEPFDNFGDYVVISTDGSTIIVGATSEDGGGTQSGSAYVFSNSSGSWAETAKLEASDKSAGAYFGWRIGISYDGSTALVGAFAKDNAVPDSGAAYVFSNSSGSWAETAKLEEPSPLQFSQFGYAVSISADGKTAAVGARFSDPNGVTNAGAAYVFSNSSGSWTLVESLYPSDSAQDDQFGSSISISADGRTVLVGSPYEDPNGVSAAGSAYVFSNSSGSWAETAKFFASDIVTADQLSYEISISGDGETALVGAPFGSVGGAAYIFSLS